ncbi:MAG: sensor histidine kinase [Pseudomonadota bacterium]
MTPPWRDLLPAVDPLQRPLLLKAVPLVAAVTLVLWLLDMPHLLTGRWDRLGLPVLATVMIAATLVMLHRPAWSTPAMLCVMAASGIYLQGIVYLNLFAPTANHLYSLLSTAQFMPLFYLGAFAGFQRGAPLLCWLQFGGLVVQLVASLMHPRLGEPNLLMQAKTGILLAQPTFILVLTFLVRLRRELAAREREHHEGKARLLAMLSHEIRGPLQTMLSSVGLLSARPLDASATRAVQRLEAVAVQLDRHLRDLLAFNQLDNPDLPIEHRSYDLPTLVRSSGEQYLPQARQQGLELLLQLPDEAPEGQPPHPWHHAQGDPDRVRQVLDNLLVNALKYTPHGRITVTLQPDPSRAGWACLSVRDTGPGIDADEQARIFQPFVRLPEARQGGREGSGLGLAIAARLTDRLGGEIHVDSVPGQGSCFTVNLPLNLRPAARL